MVLARLSFALTSRLAVLILVACATAAAQPSTDWPARIKQLVDRGHVELALSVSEDWIKIYPRDLDARSWHARLLAWSRHWGEAELEYRSLLESAPEDSDLLLDLAHLFTWQKRYLEALGLAEHACTVVPKRGDCDLERARILRLMGRHSEARKEYQKLFDSAVAPEESKLALAELSEAARHKLQIGATADFLNYTDNAGSAGASLDSRWNERWSSLAAVAHHNRFGQAATLIEVAATYRLTSADAVTLGGGTAGDQGIVPRAQVQFEYGHGFRLRGERAVRGVEATWQQSWLWYRGARVLSLTPAATLYLPRECEWLLRLSITRLDLPGPRRSWMPSGLTRLTFPIHRTLTGHVQFSTGSENFGTLDQVLFHSTRTVGGGLRIRLTPRQEIITFLQYQSLAPGRSQTGLGIAYALRL